MPPTAIEDPGDGHADTPPADWPLIAGTTLDIRPDLAAEPWRDLSVADLRRATLARIGVLPGGTTTGRASVALLAVLDDGTHVVVETTWRLLHTAVRAIAAAPYLTEEA